MRGRGRGEGKEAWRGALAFPLAIPLVLEESRGARAQETRAVLIYPNFRHIFNMHPHACTNCHACKSEVRPHAYTNCHACKDLGEGAYQFIQDGVDLGDVRGF